jgi:hypothetical protein
LEDCGGDAACLVANVMFSCCTKDDYTVSGVDIKDAQYIQVRLTGIKNSLWKFYSGVDMNVVTVIYSSFN